MFPVPSHTNNVPRSYLRDTLLCALLLAFASPLLAQEIEKNPVDKTEQTVDVSVEPEAFVPTMEYVEESEETAIDDSELSLTTGLPIDSVIRAGTLSENYCNDLVIHSGVFRVTLDLGDTYNYGLSAFSVSANLKIEGIDSSGGTETVVVLHDPVALSINQDAPEQVYFREYSGTTLANHDLVDVYRVSVNSYSVTGSVAGDVRVTVRFEDEFAVDPRLPSPDAGEPILYFTSKETTISTNPVEFAWQVAASCADRFPAYQLQILRLYNIEESYEDDEVETRAIVDWSQALTLEVPGGESAVQSTQVTLAEGTGWYIWRARPIGSVVPGGTGHSRNWGVWTDAPATGDVFEATSLDGTGGSFFDSCGFFFYQPEDTLNWSYRRAFAEGENNRGSRVAEGMTFVTPLGAVAQSQRRIAEEGTYMTTNSVSDFQGRPTLAQMSAPTGDSTQGFYYRHGRFNRDTDVPYTAEHFDDDDNYDEPELVQQTWESVSSYYDGGFDANFSNVADAQRYPFARTVISTDGSGRASEIGGVGEVFRLGSQLTGQERSTRIYFASASETELIRLFGDEAPADTSVYKMLVTNPNKVTTVQWVSGGRVIATALETEMGDTLLVPLDHPSERQLQGTIVDTLRGNRSRGQFGTSAVKRYAFTQPTEITVRYQLNPDTLRAVGNCFDTCMTCDYKVRLYVHHLDIADSTEVLEFNLGADPCGTSLSIDTAITVSLPAGSYAIERRLQSNTIDTATVDSLHPYGITYAEQFREAVGQMMMDSILMDDSVETLLGHLRNGDLTLAYDYLGLDPDSLHTYGTYTLVTECCEVTFPILLPDCGLDACRDTVPDFEQHLFDTWGDTNLYTYFRFDGTDSVFVHNASYPHPFNDLVANMLGDSIDNEALYSCKELWEIWDGLVKAWGTLRTHPDHPTDTTEFNPDFDLLDMFLTAAGRYLTDKTSAPYGATEGYLNWAHRYVPAAATTSGFCKDELGYSSSWDGEIDSSHAWEALLKCWKGSQRDNKIDEVKGLGLGCDLSEVIGVAWVLLSQADKNDSCLVYTARDIEDGAKAQCEARRDEWAWEIFNAYEDASQPISFEAALCAADAIVDSCRNGTELTVFESLDGNNEMHVDSVGSPEEWQGIARAYTWNVEVDVPLEDGQGDPYCENDSATLTEDRTVDLGQVLVDRLNREVQIYWSLYGGTYWTGFMDIMREIMPGAVVAKVSDSTIYVPPFSVDGTPPYFEISGTTNTLYYYADTVQWSDVYTDLEHPMVSILNSAVNDLWSFGMDSTDAYISECIDTVNYNHDPNSVGRRYDMDNHIDRHDSTRNRWLAEEVSFVNGEAGAMSIATYVDLPGYASQTNVTGYRVPGSEGRFVAPTVWVEVNPLSGNMSNDRILYSLTSQQYYTDCFVSFTIGNGCIADSGNIESYPVGNWLLAQYPYVVAGSYTDVWGQFVQDSAGRLAYKQYLDVGTVNGAASLVVDKEVEAFPALGISFFADPDRTLGDSITGIFSCPDICWRWIPAPPITADSSTIVGPIPCEETAARRMASAIYGSARRCVEEEVFNLKKEYEAKCGSADSLDEQITVEHDVDYLHFTLYYYDRAGNLVRTVPPMGVDILPSNATRGTPTNHTFITEYDYDSEGRLIRTQSPDGGDSRVWYDEFGRLRFSQDARLDARGEYAYTKYDVLGRVIESGVSTEGVSGDDFMDEENINDPDFPSTGSERTYIAYDTAVSTLTYIDGSSPKHLRNRVSRTWTDDGASTNFSYDIHGNIEWVAQEVPGLTRVEPGYTGIYQYLKYYYDLISGNVNQVIYNENRIDEFRHRYTYDRDNALVKVETSRDSVVWDADARYEYYQHGPLRRIELGEDYVQGLDFTWTLDGRLKAINNPDLVQANDPGKDGLMTAHQLVAADSFGIILNYHPYDFRSVGLGYFQFGTIPNDSPGELIPVPLYDGNISSVDLHIGKSTDVNHKYEERFGTSYRYDQLGRLDSSRIHTHDAGTDTWNPFLQEYLTTYDYDANGNIVSLVRHSFLSGGTTLMDSLQYNYKSSITNQLDFVKDAVAGDPFTEDIEHNQVSGNYDYDEIGNLIADDDEGGMTMAWEAGGRVKSVNHAIAGGNGQQIEYVYDAGGSRIKKTVTTPTTSEIEVQTTYYVRDAIGTVVAIYEESCTEPLLPDSDLDGIADHLDNCPSLVNPFQEDFDGDGAGDRCDTDDDNDGLQDAIDPCPYDATNTCTGTDPDSDGIPNGIDNCPTVFNPGQIDSDGDGMGDACDTDWDNDGRDNDHDPCIFDSLDECDCEIELVELPIYGSGRIGVAHPDISINDTLWPTDIYTREIGEKSYELTDHLGNVRAVISDRKRAHSPGTGGYFAEFTAYTNIYPYGMPQPGRSWDSTDLRYRYGFNGMESDPEVKLEEGHHMTTFFRQYDPRVARWWSNDPVTHSWQSPYNAMDANPVYVADPSGANGSPGSEIERKEEPSGGLGEVAGSAGSGGTGGAGNSGGDEGRRREAGQSMGNAVRKLFREINRSVGITQSDELIRETFQSTSASVGTGVGASVGLSAANARHPLAGWTQSLIDNPPPPWPSPAGAELTAWDWVYIAQSQPGVRQGNPFFSAAYSLLDDAHVLATYFLNGREYGTHLHRIGGLEFGGNEMAARGASLSMMWAVPAARSGSSLRAVVQSETVALSTRSSASVGGASRSATTTAQTYYPPNHGAAGAWTSEYLAPGTLLDRYGLSPKSDFLSPAGTPATLRAMPPSTAVQPIHTFEVLKPLPVQQSVTAPWFGELGGGVQYRTPVKIEILVRRGILGEIIP